ncbi:MAG TPA: fatty acid desaturase [Turneriella sp.]|nr:fatty acid desaturase [Turneriella sp.]HNE19439.1 fatty acid desaturase [Turneriella sp.]HNL09413.1 fatty acid desaturase [Turneriella sp.]
MKLAFKRPPVGRTQWVSIAFLSLSPVIGFGALAYFLHTGTLSSATVTLAVVIATIAGMGTTAGYHRLFSHRSYEAALPVRVFMLLIGLLGLQGSALEWSLDHRTHHKFVDRDKDPYSITKGFWFAHMLWIFKTRPRDWRPSHNADLFRDKFVFWQHRFFMPLAVVANFILPAAVAGLFWGDLWGGLLIAGFLRLVFTHHSTFFINSLCHIAGSQPYSNKHTARDNWITAFFTWGEGYHNFHHEFANDYRNGVRWYQYDPGKWLIWLLSHLHLASNLKRVPDTTIRQRCMQMQKGELLSKLEKWGWTEERKQLFRAQLEETFAAFRRRATVMNEIRNRMKSDAVQATQRRFELMQERYERLQDAVEETAVQWKLLRRRARI